MDVISDLEAFRVDYLRILHNQMRWHGKFDKLLSESLASVERGDDAQRYDL